MKKFILVVAILAITGCAGQVASRNELLKQLRDNLKNDIGPKYRGYLDKDTDRPEALRKADYQLVTISIESIDRVLGEGDK